MNWITYLFVKLGLLEIVEKINIKEKKNIFTNGAYLIEKKRFAPLHS